MVDMKTYSCLDDVFVDLLRAIEKEGSVVNPRGLTTREIVGVSFRLNDPRSRLILSPARRWSLPLAIGEFCWHVRAATDVGTLSYYSKAWDAMTEDGRSIEGSCYGHQIFAVGKEEISQWERVLRELRRDASSRRAIMTFRAKRYLPDAKDVPCVTSIQFLMRDSRLHLLTHMRSNDLIWGLGYDVFLLTMLQELMALELGVQLGWYQHTVGSAHVYSRHDDLTRRILDESESVMPPPAVAMPPIPGTQGLAELLRFEEKLRAADDGEIPALPAMGSYWDQLGIVLLLYRMMKSPTLPARRTSMDRLSAQLERPFTSVGSLMNDLHSGVLT